MTSHANRFEDTQGIVTAVLCSVGISVERLMKALGPSVCTNETALEPLNGCLCNLILGNVTKICRTIEIFC